MGQWYIIVQYFVLKYVLVVHHNQRYYFFKDNCISVTSDSVIVGIDKLFSMPLAYSMGLEILLVLLAKLGAIY